MATEATVRQMDVAGVPVSIVNMQSLVPLLLAWAQTGPARSVFVRDVHGVVRAIDDPALRKLHDEASLVVPDGMPLTWIGRFRGYGRAIGRTPGFDIVDAVCSGSQATGARHFFYGGKTGVAELLIETLKRRYPDLNVVGSLSPPFRDLVPGEAFDAEALAELRGIATSKADIIWVGLSTPKQEAWMSNATKELDHGVLLGVGAAFDFHAGLVKRAPRWMSQSGLEWLHRLLSEPQRLWRRYLILAPRFVGMVVQQEIRSAMHRRKS